MATDISDLQRGSEPSLSSLVQGVIKDVQELTAQQLQLFKTEMTNDFARSRDAAVPILIGAVVALVGAVVVSLGLAELLHWAFAPDLHRWAAYLIVGGVVTAGGGLAIFLGIRAFQSFNPLPDKTVDALKENLTWPTKT
jgi:hypothetical protein